MKLSSLACVVAAVFLSGCRLDFVVTSEPDVRPSSGGPGGEASVPGVEPSTSNEGFTPPPAGTAPGIVRAFERVNAYRAQAKLPPVSYDPEMSAACLKHAEYLRLNAGHPSLEGLGAHREDPALPGYTPEGEKAGASSDLAGEPSLEASVDAWMSSLYHRGGILTPGLTRVGLAFLEAKPHPVSVLSFEYGGPSTGYPVAYPADQQSDVPLYFHGETPDPLPPGAPPAGYPITLFFGEAVTGVTGNLTDESGQVVPVHFSSPEQPALASFPQGNNVCMFAKRRLRPATTYTASVSATGADGVPRTRRWRFTTAAAKVVDPADKAALERAVGSLVSTEAPVADVLTHENGTVLLQFGADLRAWIAAPHWAHFGFTPAELLARRVELLGVLKQRDSHFELDLRDPDDVRPVDSTPPTSSADDPEAVPGAVGRLVTVTGHIASAETNSDGGLSLRLASPARPMLLANVTPEASKALSRNPEDMVGQRIALRCVPLSSEADFVHMKVAHPDQVRFEPGSPLLLDLTGAAALEQAAGRFVKLRGRVTYTGEDGYFALRVGGAAGPAVWVFIAEANTPRFQAAGYSSPDALKDKQVEILGVPRLQADGTYHLDLAWPKQLTVLD